MDEAALVSKEAAKPVGIRKPVFLVRSNLWTFSPPNLIQVDPQEFGRLTYPSLTDPPSLFGFNPIKTFFDSIVATTGFAQVTASGSVDSKIQFDTLPGQSEMLTSHFVGGLVWMEISVFTLKPAQFPIPVKTSPTDFKAGDLVRRGPFVC